MSTRCYGVYGAGGLGREVMPLLRAQLLGEDVDLVFIDDGVADGKNVLSFESFCALPHREKFATLAIANSAIRERLDKRCSENGVGIVEVRADNSVILDRVEIGEGALLCNFVLLTSDIRIGRQFQANFYAYVAHDCVIGDYVTLAPGARCNGNIHIEDHAYIGSGAVLRQGTPDKPLRIGRGALVGMGAVVTRDVPAGETWIGNPARRLQR